MEISSVLIFFGVGGLTYGLQEEGLKVVAGFDIDLAARYPFEHNNSAKFILQDVCEVRAEEIKQPLAMQKYAFLPAVHLVSRFLHTRIDTKQLGRLLGVAVPIC